MEGFGVTSVSLIWQLIVDIDYTADESSDQEGRQCNPCDPSEVIMRGTGRSRLLFVSWAVDIYQNVPVDNNV